MHRKNSETAGPKPKTVELDGVRLHLSHPNEVLGEWIGQSEVLHQLLACWIVVDPQDLPLSPRLLGPPGIGKTALGMAGRGCGTRSCTCTNARPTRVPRICW